MQDPVFFNLSMNFINGFKNIMTGKSMYGLAFIQSNQERKVQPINSLDEAFFLLDRWNS